MRSIELFAGCGGLAKGLELAGFKHSALLEINHQACESLRANYNPSIVHEVDIKKVDFRVFEGIDVISGGPPCQPFSLGGLSKAYEDSRDMFPQASRSIAEAKPRAFLFENVKGLLRDKFKPYFDYILMRLSYPECEQKCGESWQCHANRLKLISKGLNSYEGVRYRIQYKLLNAADYGVAQVRERVFIVGIRTDITAEWEWPGPICPTPKSRIPISAVLRDVPDPSEVLKYAEDHIFIGGAKIYPGHTGSDIDKPSKTIKAGAHVVPGGDNMLRFRDGSVRYMTVHEAKLIQSFPKDYKITGSWGEALRQIGNAVPVAMANVVAQRLYSLLSSEALKGDVKEVYSSVYPKAGMLKNEQMLLAIERKKAKMSKKEKASGLKGKTYSKAAKPKKSSVAKNSKARKTVKK
jgi:DNA (cytosine-5)-methyltransferase 1